MNPLKEILFALHDRGIRFIVAGGVACVLHGVERVTMDLDISLAMDEPNIQAFLDLAAGLGLRPRAPVPPEMLLDQNHRRWLREEKNALVFTFLDPDVPQRQIDVFLTENCAFDALAEDAIEVDLDGHAIRVVSILRLMALKKAVHPARPKDVLDLQELERLHGQQDA